MTKDSNGYVRLSSKATWDKDEHPEALEQHPTLELKLELTGYTSRKTMADMLRVLANAVDEGSLHPFDRPMRDKEITGTWDDENKRWIVEGDDG